MKPMFLLITILVMISILCPAGRAQRPLTSFLNSLYSSAWLFRRSSTTTSSSSSELSTSANTVTETITLTETTTVNWIERIETTLSSVQVETYCSSVMKESQPSPSVLASIVDKVHNILAVEYTASVELPYVIKRSTDLEDYDQQTLIQSAIQHDEEP